MSASAIRNAFSAGNGVFRLAPNWVPRSFCIPGRRIKLHPDDYYALGGQRGGIDERWLGCTTPADNGLLAGLLQVLRQSRPPAPSCPPPRRTREAGRSARQAGGLLLPAAVEQPRRPLPVHLLRLRAGHDQRAGPRVSGELHQRRQQDHQPLQSLPARTRHRLGCPARRAARPRQFLHL